MDCSRRPRYGSCFEEMRKSKLRYKQEIRKKEKEGSQHFSDSLADALLHKDMNSFWKSWRSKRVEVVHQISLMSTDTHVILLTGLQISLKVLAYRIQMRGTKN